jgi:hypothetical protein
MKKLGLVLVLAVVAAALGCRPSEPTPEPTPAPAPGTAAALTENGEPLESKEGTKHAWIYFTHNHEKGGESPYKTDCVAAIVAERIGAQMGTKDENGKVVPGTRIIWHIRLGNGFNNDDKCMTLDTSKIYLRFDTDVMGKPAGRRLNAMGMKIEGTVSSDKGDIGAILDHKYQVMYDNGAVDPKMHDPAGPDPIVVVGCSSCGDPPTN